MGVYIYSTYRVAHIPTAQEFTDLKSIMDGLGLTAGTDYKTKLHIPLAGYRHHNSGEWSLSGIYAFLRASTTPTDQPSPDNTYAYYLRLNNDSDSPLITGAYRSFGFSIRLFLDEYIEPDNTRTVVDGTLGSAGIFHNATLGVISVTNGDDKNITMYDKNLGATTVYNDGDTLSDANCGRMFQRGNYFGFKTTGTISNTSTTRVDTTGYGPTHRYSSSLFVLGQVSPAYDRSQSSNNNLWTDNTDQYFVII